METITMNIATSWRVTSCSLLHRYLSAMSLSSATQCPVLKIQATNFSWTLCSFFPFMLLWNALHFSFPLRVVRHLFPSQNHFKHLYILRPQPTPLVCLRPFRQLFILLPCKWRQQFPPKQWYPSTNLHGVIPTKTLTFTFTAVRGWISQCHKMFSFQTLKVKVRLLRRKRLRFASDSRPGSVLQEALQFLFQSGNWFKMTLQVNIKRQGHGLPTLAVSPSEIKSEGQSFSSSVSKWYRTN